MLGETYELVTDKFRFLTEKTSHSPHQISCEILEAEDYTLSAWFCPTPSFAFNGGRGCIKIDTKGQWDIHFNKYNEDISITKSIGMAKNIIWGGMYIDADCIMEGVNH